MTKSENTKIALLEQSMEQNTHDHLEIKNLICELKTDFKDFKKSADERYAPRWVATFMYGLIVAGALYILQAVLRSIGVK